MAAEAELCPQCGGAIHFAENQKDLVCPYCGTTIVNKAWQPPAPAGNTLMPGDDEAHQIVRALVTLHLKLASQGVVAPAQIVSAQPTDYVIHTPKGDGRVVSFVLEVHPDGGPPFSAEARALVSLPSLAKYQPGATEYVRYNPRDPKEIELDHRP